jgi:hypothetical protein
MNSEQLHPPERTRWRRFLSTTVALVLVGLIAGCSGDLPGEPHAARSPAPPSGTTAGGERLKPLSELSADERGALDALLEKVYSSATLPRAAGQGLYRVFAEEGNQSTEFLGIVIHLVSHDPAMKEQLRKAVHDQLEIKFVRWNADGTVREIRIAEYDIQIRPHSSGYTFQSYELFIVVPKRLAVK